MKKRFNVKFSDLLTATLVLFFGIAFVNAEGITVTAVPVQQVINGQFVTFSTSTNNTVYYNNVNYISNNTNTCVKFNTLLREGSKGSKVLELQKLLNRTQNAGINETGYFGSMTKNAVKNFQYKYGINPVSGIVWTKTNFVLNKIDCGGSINVVNSNKYISTKSNLNYLNLDTNSKTFKNKAIPAQAKAIYDKSGNVVTDATGAPTSINFGTNVNINPNINKIVAEASKTLNATTSTTTVKIQKQSIWQKIQNSFGNFWARYKANFQK